MVAGKKLIIFCPMSNMNIGKPKCLARVQELSPLTTELYHVLFANARPT